MCNSTASASSRALTRRAGRRWRGRRTCNEPDRAQGGVAISAAGPGAPLRRPAALGMHTRRSGPAHGCRGCHQPPVCAPFLATGHTAGQRHPCATGTCPAGPLGAPRCMGRIGRGARRRGAAPARHCPRRSADSRNGATTAGRRGRNVWTRPENRWRTAPDGGHRPPGRGTGSWANQPPRAVSGEPVAATPHLSTAGPPPRPPSAGLRPPRRAPRPPSIAARPRTGIPRFHGMMTVMMRCKDRSLTPPEIHGPARRAGIRPGDNPT